MDKGSKSLSKEQTNALHLLEDLLTENAPLTEADKKIVGNFISECISNEHLNEAALALLIKNKNAPLAATIFVLSLSYRTRKLPEISQSLETEDQYKIQSLRHYSIVRDLAYLQKVFKDLPAEFINDHESLSQLHNKIIKSHEIIDLLDQKIMQDMIEQLANNQPGLFFKENKKEEQKLAMQILLYFKLLMEKFDQAQNKPSAQKGSK